MSLIMAAVARSLYICIIQRLHPPGIRESVVPVVANIIFGFLQWRERMCT